MGKDCWGCRGIFADTAGGMSSYWVEVAQAGDSPGARSAGAQIGEHALDGSFAVAVGVDRLDRCCLRNWHRVGVAVEGGTAVENQGAAIVGVHCGQKSAEPHTFTSQ